MGKGVFWGLGILFRFFSNIFGRKQRIEKERNLILKIDLLAFESIDFFHHTRMVGARTENIINSIIFILDL